MKVRMFTTVILLCLALLQPNGCLALKRALLIGVGNYRSLPAMVKGRFLRNLRGPENDVLLLKNTLLSYGFDSSSVKVLVDENATRENIWQAFNKWLIRGSGDGDEIVFYFSGHGTRVEDRDGDEKDGFDEALCPYDIDPDTGDNLIIDDEFRVWLKMLEGRHVTVVIDSCYSGGATRSIDRQVVSQLEPTPALQIKALPAVHTHVQREKIGPHFREYIQQDNPENVIFLGAASEAQAAFERQIDISHIYGSFTYSLANASKRLFNPTYEQLLNATKRDIEDRMGLPQTPVLIAKRELRQRHVFGGKIQQAGKISPGDDIVQRQGSPTVRVAIEDIEGASSTQMTLLRRRVAAIPFVRLVSSNEFFDRLLRGSKEKGKFRVQCLNQIGDVSNLNADNLEEVMEWLEKGLRYAWMVKKLANITNPRPDFMVELQVTERDRTDFFFGEEISFKVRSDRDAYVMLLNVDNNGDFRILFPNKYCRDNFLRGNTTLSIPDKRMEQTYLRENRTYFKFIIGPPAGEEIVKVIATDRPLDLSSMGIRDFQILFDNSGMLKVPRGIEEAVLFKLSDTLHSQELSWSEDSVIFRSHPREPIDKQVCQVNLASE